VAQHDAGYPELSGVAEALVEGRNCRIAVEDHQLIRRRAGNSPDTQTNSVSCVDMASVTEHWLADCAARAHSPGMFAVTEKEAAVIRAAFEQRGELSAAVELRRLFPASATTCRRGNASVPSRDGDRCCKAISRIMSPRCARAAEPTEVHEF
jgi:hypothetical protein